MEREWVKTLKKIMERKKALKEFKEKVMPMLDEIEKKLDLHSVVSPDNYEDFSKLENEFVRFGSAMKTESKLLASVFRMDKNKE